MSFNRCSAVRRAHLASVAHGFDNCLNLLPHYEFATVPVLQSLLVLLQLSLLQR